MQLAVTWTMAAASNAVFAAILTAVLVIPVLNCLRINATAPVSTTHNNGIFCIDNAIYVTSHCFSNRIIYYCKIIKVYQKQIIIIVATIYMVNKDSQTVLLVGGINSFIARLDKLKMEKFSMNIKPVYCAQEVEVNMKLNIIVVIDILCSSSSQLIRYQGLSASTLHGRCYYHSNS